LEITGTGDDEVSLSGAWRDNDDNTYTGSFTDGDDTIEVTLRVTGGVVVKGPQDGFQTDTSGMALFSGGLEPFGLAALDAPEDFAEEEQSDEEGEKLQLSDLLSGGDEESLTDLLPEEEKAG